MRTIDWVDGAVEIIDQTALPAVERRLRLSTVDDLVRAIVTLAVRGAPALGVAGAFGVALAAREFAGDPAGLADAIHRLKTARPTAVNLARGVRRAAAHLGGDARDRDGGDARDRDGGDTRDRDGGDTRGGDTRDRDGGDTRGGDARDGDGGDRDGRADAVLAEAFRVRDEEIESTERMATRGADLVTDLCGRSVRLLTHCNTGGLATVTGGTALAVIAELHRRGTLAGVIASETRPLLQGARLTAWELGRLGIPYRVAVDSAGPFLMARGQVDAVILGADRICANGDVVNKVGSYAHALGARAAGIPFVVVAPESTVDTTTATGADVEIEDRGTAEVVRFAGEPVAPVGAEAVNPAFDVTPHDLVTAIVTDRRIIRKP